MTAAHTSHLQHVARLTVVVANTDATHIVPDVTALTEEEAKNMLIVAIALLASRQNE